ncbi:hypothetical protein [Neobacillus soli]|uniref:hypothetical protein n=1 Tax=Neobacillus soli TaxID=220688 RepID=UPI0008269F78|nr:hypothetical protein [Neobacillus soli]
MGLFINNKNHPDVYKNNQELHEPNQMLSRQDYLTMLINEQQKANAALTQAFAEIGLQTQQQEEIQVTQWRHIDNQLSDLRSKLERNEDASYQLAQQMDKQLELQMEVSEKVTKQADLQGGMLQRLDNQEALIEKISRQVNHIRSILFERTNYLATKIDDGYKVTSSYVYKLMTGSDQPLTFFLMNHKKEENQQHPD